MSFQQLDPPLPVHLLDKGAGHALGLFDGGAGESLTWVVAVDDTGEIWRAPTSRVRMQPHWAEQRAAVTQSFDGCSGVTAGLVAEAVEPN